MITLHLLFPKGIQNFLRETVKKCGTNGHVKTLLGRKRFLPGIKDPNMYIKSHVRTYMLVIGMYRIFLVENGLV